MFLAKNQENARKSADANFAMEQVKRIDNEVGKCFKALKLYSTKV